MRLTEFIQTNTKSIAQQWEIFARSIRPAGVSKLLLRNDIEPILAAIAHDMRQPQTAKEQAEKSYGVRVGPRLDLAGHGHARQRIDVGFRLDEAVSELRALRASVVRLWEESSPEPAANDRSDLIRFNEAIDQILVESMNTYSSTRDRYREQFIGILGHDLRNPLGAILMSARFMSQAGDLDLQRARAVTMILKSAGRMSRLLSDVLDLTRVRLGSGLPLTPAPMDLEAVCRPMVEELAASHPDRALRFEPSGDLHGVWDADRLAQVVSNLAGNALQHGDSAPVLVTAWAEGDRVALAVHNEGRPIPREDLGRIFEPMVQSRKEEAAKPAENLGLGLFIVHEIVSAHGGEIAVTSSEEQGTTFTVRLPRSPAAHSPG